MPAMPSRIKSMYKTFFVQSNLVQKKRDACLERFAAQLRQKTTSWLGKTREFHEVRAPMVETNLRAPRMIAMRHADLPVVPKKLTRENIVRYRKHVRRNMIRWKIVHRERAFPTFFWETMTDVFSSEGEKPHEDPEAAIKELKKIRAAENRRSGEQDLVTTCINIQRHHDAGGLRVELSNKRILRIPSSVCEQINRINSLFEE